jgi:5-deoxy-D-glucuronate isomerase
MLEEIYVYVDMPAPAFGMQLVYTDEISPAEVEVVREGDAVLLPAGYHPNVSIGLWRTPRSRRSQVGSCADRSPLWLNR